MAYQLLSNTPGPGYISWTGASMIYNGSVYSITDGSTDKPYVWWQSTNSSVFQVSNIWPAIGSDPINDCLVFTNENGFGISVLDTDNLVGSALTEGSIDFPQLAVGSVRANNIAAGAIQTEHLAAAIITADNMQINSIRAEHITAGSISADKIDVIDLFAQELTINGNNGYIQSANYVAGTSGFFLGWNQSMPYGQQEGYFEAANAVIRGTVFIGDGSTIDDITIGTPSTPGLYMGNNYIGFYDTSWKVFIKNASGVGRFYAGDGGVTMGTNKFLLWDGATLQVSGNISSTSGSIGGWTLGATGLSATNISITSGTANAANISVGTGSFIAGLNAANVTSDIAFWAGNTFANRATAPFRVTLGGSLTATQGAFGNGTNLWTIGGSGANSSLYWNKSSIDSTTSGVYMGTDGISFSSYDATSGYQQIKISNSATSTQLSFSENLNSTWIPYLSIQKQKIANSYATMNLIGDFSLSGDLRVSAGTSWYSELVGLGDNSYDSVVFEAYNPITYRIQDIFYFAMTSTSDIYFRRRGAFNSWSYLNQSVNLTGTICGASSHGAVIFGGTSAGTTPLIRNYVNPNSSNGLDYTQPTIPSLAAGSTITALYWTNPSTNPGINDVWILGTSTGLVSYSTNDGVTWSTPVASGLTTIASIAGNSSIGYIFSNGANPSVLKFSTNLTSFSTVTLNGGGSGVIKYLESGIGILYAIDPSGHIQYSYDASNWVMNAFMSGTPCGLCYVNGVITGYSYSSPVVNIYRCFTRDLSGFVQLPYNIPVGAIPKRVYKGQTAFVCSTTETVIYISEAPSLLDTAESNWVFGKIYTSSDITTVGDGIFGGTISAATGFDLTSPDVTTGTIHGKTYFRQRAGHTGTSGDFDYVTIDGPIFAGSNLAVSGEAVFYGNLSMLNSGCAIYGYLIAATTVQASNHISAGSAIYLNSTSGGITANSFTALSKREYKDNIETFDKPALDLIKNVSIVGFTYKNDVVHQPRIGFIADDTDSLLSGTNHDSMDLTNCIGVLMKAVQELHTELEILKNKKPWWKKLFH